MTKCPKCDDVLAIDARACACGWRLSPAKPSGIDLQCAWNDHGYRCTQNGSMSDSMNGSGPWYCSDHYWFGLKQFKRHNDSAPKLSFRERWYLERGLSYEPPKAGNMVMPKVRERQPGEDEEEAA